MKTVGTAELKAHLSSHLRSVRRGETITILDRREPVARLVPIDAPLSPVVVRPAKPGLHGVRLLPPVRDARGDVVEDLMAERAERP